MDFDYVRKMDREDLCKLIDLIEGMPPSLNRYVKLNISKPEFYKSIVNGNTILLNDNNSIDKFIDKKLEIKYVRPCNSMLQSFYSEILEEIDKLSTPSWIKSKLKMILDSPSFDDYALSEVELSIVSLIDDIGDDKSLFDIVNFINNRIMVYKLSVYDFYTYTVLNYLSDFTDYKFNTHECNYLTDLYHLLTNTLYKRNISLSYTDYNNISSLIYGYFKEIGISSVIEKYNLLTRFIIPLQQYSDDDAVETIKRFILDKINSDISAGDNIHELFNMKMYTINIPDTDLSPNSIAKEVDSMTIMFKDMNLIPDIENMRLQLSMLNRYTISEYIDVAKGYNIFLLSENDVCYLRDIEGIKLGTVYDSSLYGMRYIAYYDGEFYLLFKNNISTTIIYGISLNKDTNGNRKILKIKKDRNFTYKYISTI